MINVTELNQEIQIIPLETIEETEFTVNILMTNNTTAEVTEIQDVFCQAQNNGFVFYWVETLDDGDYTADFVYNRNIVARESITIDLIPDTDPEEPHTTPSYYRQKTITKHDVDSVVIKRSRTKNIFTR